MNTATKVKTEIHRQGMQALEPLRRIRQEIESDTVGRVSRIGIQFAFEHFFCPELDFGVGKTDLDGRMHAAVVEEDAVSLDIVVFQYAFDLPHHGSIDFDGRPDTADLDGR